MRKWLICAPMMTLLLLVGCAGGPGMSRAEELALTIRGEHLELTGCTMNAAITADYGQRVVRYEMDAVSEGDTVTLTLTAPETVAGITASAEGETGQLEYDGMWVETGPLDGDGLTPMSAIPALLEAVRSGYITACALEEEDTFLRVDCGDPEKQPGTGVEYTLWFDVESHALKKGEIRCDGFRRVLCEFSEFKPS